MGRWLERAVREFAKGAEPRPAIAAEGNPTALTSAHILEHGVISDCSNDSNGGIAAGPNRHASVAIALPEDEEHAVRAWLTYIDERDELVIAEVLERCRTDVDARAYFLCRAEEIPRACEPDDDRRTCAQCTNLTARGICLAARRGEISAARDYEPIRHLPRRCEGYAPRLDDPDHRSGRDRWPMLHKWIGDQE